VVVLVVRVVLALLLQLHKLVVAVYKMADSLIQILAVVEVALPALVVAQMVVGQAEELHQIK